MTYESSKESRCLTLRTNSPQPVTCPKCSGHIFEIYSERDARIDQVINGVGENYSIFFVCTNRKCKYECILGLGSD